MAPPAGAAHLGDLRLEAVQDSGDVDVEHGLPVGDGKIGEGAPPRKIPALLTATSKPAEVVDGRAHEGLYVVCA